MTRARRKEPVPGRRRRGWGVLGLAGLAAALVVAWLARRDAPAGRAAPDQASRARAPGLPVAPAPALASDLGRTPKPPSGPGAADHAEGRRLAAARSPVEAAAAFRRAVEAEPDNVGYLNDLGAALVEGADYLEAVDVLGRAVHRDPAHATALTNLGTALCALGRHDEAERRLREAIAQASGQAQLEARAHEALGQTLYQAAHGEGGVDQGKLGRAIDAYRAALAVVDSPGVRVQLGQAFEARPDEAAALAEYLGAARIDPTHVPSRVKAGLLALHGGDLDVAETALREALARNPGHAEAHHVLGLVLEARGDDAGAAGQLQAAVSAEPARSESHYRLAAVLRRLGRTAEADAATAAFERWNVASEDLKDRRRTAQANPDSAAAQYNLGVSLASAGDLDGAVLAYQRAVTVDPHLATAHANLGIIWLERGQLGPAEAALRRAVTLDAGNAAAHHALGRLHAGAGDRAAAIAALEAALARQPDRHSARLDLAGAYLAGGRPADARRTLEELVRLQPRHAVAWFNLGGVCLQAGDRARAADAFRQVLAIDPAHAEARRYLALATQGR